MSLHYDTGWEKNVKNLTNFSETEELSPPDQIFRPRLANHIPSSDFHIPLAQGVLLSLILHHISQKSHPCGEGPSAWWELQEHSLVSAVERIRLPGWPAPVTKPTKRGSFPHTSQPKRFTLTPSSGTWPPGEALECSLPLAPHYGVSCVCSAGPQFRVIDGALHFMLITFVPGFQDAPHQLCQAVMAPLQLSEGQLCADCPEQDTKSYKVKVGRDLQDQPIQLSIQHCNP